MNTDNNNADKALVPGQTITQRWLKRLKSISVTIFIITIVGIGVDYYRLESRDTQTISQAELHTLVQQLTPAQQAVFEQGKPMLVYVWATWCGVCQLTSGAVNRLFESDYLISTIALKSGNTETLKKTMSAKSLTFPFYNDSDGLLSHSLAIKATPTFIIVSYTGNILYYSMGVNTEVGLRAKLALFN